MKRENSKSFPAVRRFAGYALASVCAVFAAWVLQPVAAAPVSGKAEKPFRVVLTFDGGLKDHLRIVAPELEKRGWRGVFNIMTGTVGKDPHTLDWAGIRELSLRGHEVTTHTVTHPNMVKLLKKKDVARVREELVASRDAIAVNTGFVPRYYCSPYSAQNEETGRMAREAGLVQFKMPRTNFGEGNETAVRAFLLKKIDDGATWADIMVHGVCTIENGGSGGWKSFATPAEFAAHLDAIAALEREGRIVVTDYAGATTDCALDRTAWPRHRPLEDSQRKTEQKESK